MNFPHFKKYTTMKESESTTSTGTTIENKKDNNEISSEIVDFVEGKTQTLIYKGVLLGLNESQKALNMFLDEKVGQGHTDTMSRHELNLFMQTYIGEYEKGLKINEDRNNLNSK